MEKKSTKELKKQKRQLKRDMGKAICEKEKLMWKHASWFYRIILIIGFLTLIKWGWKLGIYIKTLI